MASGNEIGSYVVSIKARIEDYQSEIDKVKKALERIDPGANVSKSLRRDLERAQKEIDALARDSTRRISSDSQITSLFDKLGKVNLLIDDMGKKLGTVKWSEMSDGFVPELKQAQSALKSIQDMMNKNFVASLSKAVQDSSELKQVFSALKLDVGKLTEEGFDEAFSSGLQRLADDAVEAQKELQNLAKRREELTQKQVEAQERPLNAFDVKALKSNAPGYSAIDPSRLKAFEDQLQTYIDKSNLTEKQTKKLTDSFKALRENPEKAASTIRALSEEFKKLGTSMTAAMGKAPSKMLDFLMPNKTRLTELAQPNAAYFEQQAKNFGVQDNQVLQDLISQLRSATGDNVERIHAQIIQHFQTLKQNLSKEEQSIANQIKEIGKSEERQRKIIEDSTNARMNAEAAKPALQQAAANAKQQNAPLLQQIQQLQQRIANLEGQLQSLNSSGTGPLDDVSSGLTGRAAERWQELNNLSAVYMQQLEQVKAREQALGNFKTFIQRWFSVYAAARMVTNAFNTIKTTLKELDDVMTEIAIVTDMTQADLWDQMSSYTAMAKQYASSIKGVYEVSQLYYRAATCYYV